MKLFEPYGTIKSHVLRENDQGKFGFVCYDDPYRKDLAEYGPRCARKAIKGLNRRSYFNKKMNDKKLFVGLAMKKEDR